MATNYFRLTVYHPVAELSAIMDSNGKFEKLWQFSSFLLQKGFKVLEVSSDEKFIDINITKVETDTEHIILRAHSKGRPENITCEINGTVYAAVKINEKIYIPDKDKRET